MSRIVRRWAAAAVLALGVALTLSSPSARSADKDDDKAIEAAQKAVLGLTGQLNDKDVGDKAKAVAKAHAIDHVMHGFKPRNKGGVGIGKEAPPAGMKDSIELAIIDMATRRNNPGQSVLDKNTADLMKMAEITLAIAEINTYYKPAAAKPKKDPKEWEKFNNDMKSTSRELIEAIKAKDQKKVTEAAKKLNQSCTDCHGVFRDS